jgi:hypothetical protein
MFGSIISDLIVVKVQCGECLHQEEDSYERVEERLRITILFCKASAISCVPLSPIRLDRRSSVVNVCVCVEKRIDI